MVISLIEYSIVIKIEANIKDKIIIDLLCEIDISIERSLEKKPENNGRPIKQKLPRVNAESAKGYLVLFEFR